MHSKEKKEKGEKAILWCYTDILMSALQCHLFIFCIGYFYNDHVLCSFCMLLLLVDCSGMMEMRSCAVFMSQQTIYTLEIFF